MRILSRLTLAVLAAAVATTAAAGQIKPETLKKPFEPVKKQPAAPAKPAPATTPAPAPAPSPAAFTPGPADLLCKNFVFGSMPGYAPFRSSLVQFQSVRISDASGAARTIYAPTRIRFVHQFKPSAAPAGARGEALASGECGLADAVIDASWAGAETTTPTMTLQNFPNMSLGEAKKGPSSSNMDVILPLPSCPSGVVRFRGNREAADSFFINGTAADALTCVE
ncbi:MAG: hypothetical protein R3C58_04450 [Parvularculaceae bacterium]